MGTKRGSGACGTWTGLSSGRFLGCSVPELPGWESLKPPCSSQDRMLQIAGLKLQAVRNLCLVFKHPVNKVERGEGWLERGEAQQQSPGSLLLLWNCPRPLCTGHGTLPLPATLQQRLGVQEPKILHRTPPHPGHLNLPTQSLHSTSEAVALQREQKIKRKFLKIQPKVLELSRSLQIRDTTCPSHPGFGVRFWGWLCFPQVPQQEHPSRVRYLGEKFPTMLPNSPRIFSMQPSTLECCGRL